MKEEEVADAADKPQDQAENGLYVVINVHVSLCCLCLIT